MPRRNQTPKHIPYQPRSARAPTKKRYNSKREALEAINNIQMYNLDLELSIYQSPVDSGWYLTSVNKP